MPTKDIPNIEEYPCRVEGVELSARVPDFPKKDVISFKKKENFSTTNPKAIIPRLVLIHAKNVLSLAK